MTFSKVDFPEPFTPTSATVCPGSMWRLTSRKTQRHFAGIADPVLEPDELIVEIRVGSIGAEALPHMVDADGALRQCRQRQPPAV